PVLLLVGLLRGANVVQARAGGAAAGREADGDRDERRAESHPMSVVSMMSYKVHVLPSVLILPAGGMERRLRADLEGRTEIFENAAFPPLWRRIRENCRVRRRAHGGPA